MEKLATIEFEAAGKTKNFLKFKEVVKEERDEESGSVSRGDALTAGMVYLSRVMFDGKEPETITVTVEG